jgi:hypothetical protein
MMPIVAFPASVCGFRHGMRLHKRFYPEALGPTRRAPGFSGDFLCYYARGADSVVEMLMARMMRFRIRWIVSGSVTFPPDTASRI